MITIRLSGGLGNQLFQYAAARSLAVFHKTQLAIDISRYINSSKRKYALQYFDLDAETVQLPCNDSGISKVKSVLSKLHYYIPFSIDYFYDYSWQTNYNFFKITSNSVLDGSFANLFYFDHIRPTLMQDIKVKQSYLSQRLHHFIYKVSNSNSVSLHIRRGDYVSENQSGASQVC
jgi:hypothetical protein